MSLHGQLTNYVEQRARKTWSATNGWAVIRTWLGRTSQFNAFINTGIPAGYMQLDVDEDGEVTTVAATYAVDAGSGGGGTEPADPISRTWALEGDDEELSLWEHPKVAAAMDLLSQDQRQFVRNKINEFLQCDQPSCISVLAGLDQVFLELAKRLASGVEVFSYSKYVLQKIELVTTRSQLKASHANRNKIFSYQRLLIEEPTLREANLIDAAGITELFWLKRTPDVVPTDRGRWQIVQEYTATEGPRYDSWIYDPAA